MELLERNEALDAMRRLLQQADDGHGALFLLGGEAGVGKTAVLRQFIAEVSPAARILLGQCDGLSTPRALGPVFDFGDATLDRLLGENAPRDLIFRTLLERISNGGAPTLLAIEDAHWADEASLDLLRYLGRRIEPAHALLIVTYRNDELGPRHPLRKLLGDLATVGAVHRLELRPLTIHAVRTLAEESDLDAARLHERTRGNPFFVTEVLAASAAIPPSVRDAVLARAASLQPSAWAVLETAAVIGSPADAGVLQAVASPSVGDLDACLETGTLLADGQTLAFRHELAREAIVSAISPPRRAALHQAILGALEGSPAEGHDSARLAYHAEEAGDAAAVLRHAPRAARKAARLQAHREEASQYARALRFSAALAPEARAHFLEARSHACYLTAQIDEAVAARREALETWLALGDMRKAGGNRAHLATLLWAQARIDDAEREAEAAIALLEQHPPSAELAMAYGTLARLSGTNLDSAYAICLGERAIALAEQTGADETLFDALMTVGEARLVQGAIASGQELIEQSMRRATDAGLDGVTVRGFISLGHGFALCGRLDDAVRHFERGIQYCAERDFDLPMQHMRALLARCQVSLGHWDDALRLADAILHVRDIAPASRFVALLVAGLVMSRRGERGAGPLLDEARELAAASGCIIYLGPIHAARAEAAALSGSAAETLAEAEAAWELAIERGHRAMIAELTYWRWHAGGQRALQQAIDGPYARQIAGDWAAAAAEWDALGHPYEAARARAESDDEPALRMALETFDALGARPTAARLRQRLRVLGARGVPRGPRPSTRSNPAGLTGREVDVALALAADVANQEIARQLYLSPRTVENHIAAIYAKLGVTTRADAARAIRELGLAAETE